MARSKIATLPVDVFLRAIKLLYDFTSERRTSDKSLHLLCGLYEVPGVSKKIILPWSPLRSFLSEEVDSLSPEDIAHHAKGWILAQFSGAVSLFHETAIDAWKKELHPRCVHFLIRGE